MAGQVKALNDCRLGSDNCLGSLLFHIVFIARHGHTDRGMVPERPGDYMKRRSIISLTIPDGDRISMNERFVFVLKWWLWLENEMWL